jgi:hypothetical protein
MIVRLLLIVGVLFTVLYYSINKDRDLNLPPVLSSYLGQIKGFSTTIPKIDGLPSDPQEVRNLLQDVASNSAVKSIFTPLLNTAQKTIETAPNDILAQLPRVIEIVTNSKKEELYLVSPHSLIVPKIENTGTERKISIQLGQFEIKDSRKSKTPWSLIINAKSTNGKILNSDISFRLKREDIQPVEGSLNGLVIEDGNRIRISAISGSGKGVFRFRPYLNIEMGKEEGLEDSKIEIESNFE